MEEKIREKLNLTVEEGRTIIYEDSEEYDVIEDVIDDTTRWSENHTIVIQRKSDGKYFTDWYSVGLTEMQDERPYDNINPNFTEVFPISKTITAYV